MHSTGLVRGEARGRHFRRRDGLLEECPRRRHIGMVAQEHVHDLATLIDGTEGVPSAATDFVQGLVHPPLVSDRMAVPARGCNLRRYMAQSLCAS